MENTASSIRLPRSFYTRTDVLAISRELLGKRLVSQIDGQRSAGIIVETEAYRGPDDKACHAHLNRFTRRTSVMFEKGGHAYVYLCYGIHHMFNVVTGEQGMAHAILIRAIEPVENTALMLKRRQFEELRPQLSAGPGVLTKALGITTAHTGVDMVAPDSPIWIEDHNFIVPENQIIASPRVGVDYAAECALWDWRFRIKDSKWTSPAK